MKLKTYLKIIKNAINLRQDIIRELKYYTEKEKYKEKEYEEEKYAMICKICNNHIDEIANQILTGKKNLSIRYCIYCGTMWIGTPIEHKCTYESDEDRKNYGKSAIIFKGFFYIPVGSEATLEYIDKRGKSL